MFTCGKHGAEALPAFLPVRTSRAACRFVAPAAQGTAPPRLRVLHVRKLF